MMKKLLGIISITLLLFGCVSQKKYPEDKKSQQPTDNKESQQPTEDNKLQLSAFSKNKDLVGALDDFTKAAQYCRKIHNHYEITSKKVEGYKLAIGGTGGVLGAIGAVLAGAGTGGYFPGIAAGLAGAASSTLASSEDGPLGTSFYSSQRSGIASIIHESSESILKAKKDPEEIAIIAHSLAASCLAAAPSSK